MYKITQKKVVVIHNRTADSILAAKTIEYAILSDTNREVNSLLFLTMGELDCINRKQFEDEKIPKEDTLICIVGPVTRVRDMDRLIQAGYPVRNILYFETVSTILRNYQGYQHNPFIGGLRCPDGYLSVAELTRLFFMCDFVQRVPCTAELTDTQKNKEYLLSDADSLAYIKSKIPVNIRIVVNYKNAFGDADNLEERMSYYIGFNLMKPSISSQEKEDQAFWDVFMKDKAGATISNLHKIGKAMYQSQLKDLKIIAKEQCFQASLKRFEEYSLVVLNNPNIDMRILPFYKKFEIGISFYYNAEKMIFRIYRLGLNPEKRIKIGDIAEAYGGCGSPDEGIFITWDSTIPLWDMKKIRY